MNDTPSASAHASPVKVAVTDKLMSPRVGYVDQVVADSVDGIAFRSFPGVRRGTDAQVVHLHRLTALGGSRNMRGKDRVALAIAFAASLRKNRIALVRTWHGADAQGTGGKALAVANWIVNRVTTEFVTVDPSVRAPGRVRSTMIPFGHYRERFIGYPRSAAKPGRVACIAPHLHESVLDVVTAFAPVSGVDASLRVVGQAPSARAEEIERCALSSAAEISTRIERVSDGTLVSEITAAEVVVVPLVAELEDLHVMMLCLSLDRPIVVPDTALTRSLAESVGEAWVHRYRGAVSGEAIDRALALVRERPPAAAPRLDGRDLETTSARYAEIFARAASHTTR